MTGDGSRNDQARKVEPASLETDYLDRMRTKRPRAIQPYGDYDPTIDAYCCWALAIEELYKRSMRLLKDDHR